MPLNFTDHHLVGIVRVPVANLILAFPGPEQLRRSEKSNDVLELVRIFQEVGFHPSASINQISGVISSDDLRNLLLSSNLSKECLLQTLHKQDFPFVAGNFKILYTEGRRRIEAARFFLGDDAWWTIKLHCIGRTTSIGDAARAFRHHDAFISHEAPYTDGEIYNGVRYYQNKGDDQSIRAWKIRLSNSKAKALDHLIARRDMSHALDRVMIFPGLRGGLQLGNIGKHLATHCDELIIRYFEHIHRIWSTILANALLQPLLDDDTVRLLQFRAPLASQDDRDFISNSMSTGILFRKITQPEDRHRIQRSVLALNGVIPSLTTFHENMKFIAIGASVIKKHLDIVQPKSCGRRTSTLLSRLEQKWDPTRQPLLEVSEGKFRLLATGPSFLLSYTQLFISVLRQFPHLSDHTALRDRKSDPTFAQLDHTHLDRLLKRAEALGFKNDKTLARSLQSRATVTNSQNCARELATVNLPDWRGGRPFGSTLIILQQSCFLPSLVRSKVRMAIPTPEFIQNDLVEAFFGDLHFAIDETHTIEYGLEQGVEIVKESVVRVDDLPEPEATSTPKIQQRTKGKVPGRHILRERRVSKRKVTNRQRRATVAKRKLRKASVSRFAQLRGAFFHDEAQQKLNSAFEVRPLIAERNEVRSFPQPVGLVDYTMNDQAASQREQLQEPNIQDETSGRLLFRDRDTARPAPPTHLLELSGEPVHLRHDHPRLSAAVETEESDSSSVFILNEADELHRNAEIGKTHPASEDWNQRIGMTPERLEREFNVRYGRPIQNKTAPGAFLDVNVEPYGGDTEQFADVPLSPSDPNPNPSFPLLSTVQVSLPRMPLPLDIPGVFMKGNKL